LPELTEREFDETVTTLGDVGYVVGGRIDRREEAAASTPTSRARAPARRCTAHGGGSTRSGSPGELAAVLEALAADAAIEESANLKRAAETVGHAGPRLLRSLAAGVLGGLVGSPLGV
jgi:hypothetical protein